MKVLSLNISKEKGTIKTPCDEIEINELGIVGDAHSGVWHRQISMLASECIEKFSREKKQVSFGEFAENITTQNVAINEAAILDRFKIGNDVELEVTQIGKKCHGSGCAIYTEVGECVMPKEGIFLRVIKKGKIKTSDKIEFIKRPLKIKIITLSDRAYAGIYKDESGPAIKTSIETFFAGKRWHLEIKNILIKDSFHELQNLIKQNDFDICITTGGTGIGPKDFTIEAIKPLLKYEIPGIMENIRMKYGKNKSSALLSRSIAGVYSSEKFDAETNSGTGLVFTLPGSVKAVNEYMNEINPVLEHAICMLHGLGH